MQRSITIEAVRDVHLGEYMRDENSLCNYEPEDVLDGVIPPSELQGELNYANLLTDEDVADIIGSKDREAIEAYKNAEENIYKDFVSDFEEVEIEFFFNTDNIDEKKLLQEYNEEKSPYEFDEWLISRGFCKCNKFKVKIIDKKSPRNY